MVIFKNPISTNNTPVIIAKNKGKLKEETDL